MDVGEKQRLHAELKKVRLGLGLTPPRLAKYRTLMWHLGSESSCENTKRLAGLAEKIQVAEQREAVREALRVDPQSRDGLTQRREDLADKWVCSVSTVRNYEKDGFSNLADLILQASPHQGHSAPEKGPDIDAVRGLKRMGLFVKECAYTFMSHSRAQGGASDDELQRYEDIVTNARRKRKELREQIGD